jgi:hypothetical protein
MRQEIVKDNHFEEIAEVKADSKNRVTIGQKGAYYKVYRNAIGQIVLDPQVTIPAHEQWLFKNKKASAMVRRGLEDARCGRLTKAPEDFSKYIDED